MADVEKFVLKIDVDGMSSIDNAIKKLDEVDGKIKSIGSKKLSIAADTSGIKSMQSQLDKLSRTATQLSNKKINFGLGDNVIGGGLSALVSDIGKVSGGLTQLAGPAAMTVTAITAIGTAGAAAAINLANVSREISNMAAAGGNVDTDVFQRWAAGAKTVGVDAQALSDIFKDFQDKIGDFSQTGGGELKDFFENIAPKVGLTFDNFKDLSGPEGIQLMMKAMEDANVPMSDMIFLFESAGNDLSKLMPLLANNGAEMKRLGDRASELGGIIDKETLAKSKELATAMDDLGTAMTALANDFGSAFTPMLTAMAEWATQAITNFRNVWKEASLFKQNIAGAMDSSYVEGQGAYDDSMDKARAELDRDDAIKAANAAASENLRESRRGGAKKPAYVSPGLVAKPKKSSGGGGKSAAVSEAEKIAKEAERERDAMIKSAKAAEDMIISMRLNNQSRMDAIDLETTLIGKSEDEADQIRATAKIRKDEADAILKLEKAIKDEMEKASPNLVAIDTFKTGIEDAKKATDAIVTAQAAYNTKLKESEDRASRIASWRTQVMELVENTKDYRIAQKQAGGQLYGSLLTEAQKRLDVERQISKEIEEGTFEFGALRDPLGKNKPAADLISTTSTKRDKGAMSDLGFTRHEIAMADEVDRRMRLLQRSDELVRSSMVAGWNDAFSQIAESMTPFNTAAQAANDLWGNISSSIDTAVETGKFKFADFRDSVIKDIAKMMAKAAASKLIGTLLGTATSALVSVIPGAPGGPAIGGDRGGSAMPRASGGSVSGGQPYLVGERGPELFMPGRNGTIIPNRNLEDTKPQVVNNYTYNVSAIDGQSVARFFMENKNMVAAANRQATKERS